jgi:hypothetical protein
VTVDAAPSARAGSCTGFARCGGRVFGARPCTGFARVRERAFGAVPPQAFTVSAGRRVHGLRRSRCTDSAAGRARAEGVSTDPAAGRPRSRSSPRSRSRRQRIRTALLARAAFILSVSSLPSRPSRLRRCSLRSQPRPQLRALLLGWLWLASRRDRNCERSLTMKFQAEELSLELIDALHPLMSRLKQRDKALEDLGLHRVPRRAVDDGQVRPVIVQHVGVPPCHALARDRMPSATTKRVGQRQGWTTGR